MQTVIVAASVIIYGLLVLIGGLMGYNKAGSKVSLISGVLSGLLLISAAIMQLQGLAWGLILARLVTAILVVVFAMRLLKTRKFMPAGLMLGIGVAVSVIIWA